LPILSIAAFDQVQTP